MNLTCIFQARTSNPLSKWKTLFNFQRRWRRVGDCIWSGRSEVAGTASIIYLIEVRHLTIDTSTAKTSLWDIDRKIEVESFFVVIGTPSICYLRSFDPRLFIRLFSHPLDYHNLL